MTIEEIKAELAKRAGTDDVPEAYADEAAALLNQLLLTIEAWSTMSDHVGVGALSRYSNEPIR